MRAAYASVEALKTRVDSVRAFEETIPGIMAPGSPCDQLGVGIEPRKSFANSLRPYPNPATNTLTIDVGEESQGTVQVHDAQGALVLQLRSTRSVVQMNVKDLASGLYHVQVRSAEGIRTGRFVKE